VKDGVKTTVALFIYSLGRHRFQIATSTWLRLVPYQAQRLSPCG